MDIRKAGAARFLFMGSNCLEPILKTDLELQLLALCEKVLGPSAFRPVDVDCRLGGKSLIRIFIERTGAQEGGKPGTATIEDCAKASGLMGTALEAESLIPGHYDLEVSSPGLERRLRLRSDFEQCIGGEVKLKLTESLQGKGANVTGVLRKVENGDIVVALGNAEILVPLLKIKRANLVWHFS